MPLLSVKPGLQGSLIWIPLPGPQRGREGRENTMWASLPLLSEGRAHVLAQVMAQFLVLSP